MASRMTKPMHQQLNMFSLSDDNAIEREILRTHAHNDQGDHQYTMDVKPLLHLAEDILTRASLINATTPMVEEAKNEILDDKNDHPTSANYIHEAWPCIIERINCEMESKSLIGGDGHTTCMSLLGTLASYSWEAKVVLTLAAFALKYGEFWLLAHICPTNNLAKSMATLKQVTGVVEHSSQLKPRFDAMNRLANVMVEVTKCVVEVRELRRSPFMKEGQPPLANAVALIPAAAYWTIKSAVVCTAQINCPTCTSITHEYVGTTSMEARDLSTLVHKLNNIFERLSRSVATCKEHIAKKNEEEALQVLKEAFDETSSAIHVDVTKVLALLVGRDGDSQPLLDCRTKQKVSIDVLRRKNVLLVISGLDISQKELLLLEQIHSDSRAHAATLNSQYEIIWIPIADQARQDASVADDQQFQNLLSLVPNWYSVSHPSSIDKIVARFFRDFWHFSSNKTVLVVLDPHGRVLSRNAIHMMLIWGTTSFPFTKHREEALWREEIWRLELLIDGIDQNVLRWIKEDKYIFLYGGNDLDWIRKFIISAKSITQTTNVQIEMLYVGKNHESEYVSNIIEVITKENLSHCWPDRTMEWFFWTRLDSIFHSMLQIDSLENQDSILVEIKKLFSHDTHGKWAMLCQGNNILVNGHGMHVIRTLKEYHLWENDVEKVGFGEAFKGHHKGIHEEELQCCHFDFATSMKEVPEIMKCPECPRMMEKFVRYRCCHKK